MAQENVEIQSEDGTMKITVSGFGASLLEWLVYDNVTKEWRDILVGANHRDQKTPYFNCICGRIANRVSNSSFKVNDKLYSVTNNHGKHSLHGGDKGLSFVEWKMKEDSNSSVTLNYLSLDQEEGYPCDVEFSVKYSIRGMSLEVEYQAKNLGNCPTPLCLTLHTYFNLDGFQSHKNVLSHELLTSCAYYVETDNELIPTGKILPVENTPFDFTNKKQLQKDIKKLLNIPHKGYDHYFVSSNNFSEFGNKTEKNLCTLSSVDLELSISSTEPGFQIYTGNYLKDIPAKSTHQKNLKDGLYQENAGVAIETHYLPDAVNQDKWKSNVMIQPGSYYHQKTTYTLNWM